MRKTIVAIFSIFVFHLTPLAQMFAETTNDVPAPIVRVENEKIGNGYFTNLNDYVDELKELDEGTIITRFRYTGSSIMSLFSLSNSNVPNGHFHLYISPTAIGSENRLQQPNVSPENTHLSQSVNLEQGAVHTIAMVADKEEGYKFFLDGDLVFQEKDSPVKFLSNIYKPNSAQLGRTERGSGGNEYLFDGDIYMAEIYDEPLSDQLLKDITKGSPKEISDIIEKNGWANLSDHSVNQTYPADNGTNGKLIYTDISQDVDTIKGLSSGAIVAKFRTTDQNGINTIFALTDTTKQKYKTHSTLAVKNGKLFFSITKNHSSPFVSDSEVPVGKINDGEWHTVAVVTNQDGTSLYLDGKKQLTKENTIFLDHLNNANHANIGRSIAVNSSNGHDYYQAGDIAYVNFYGIDLNSPPLDIEKIRAMTTNSNNDDDTWFFTGGGMTQGMGLTDGTRNYIGLFEEVVRWEQTGNDNQRQRFMINGGQEDQSVAEVNNNYSNRVAPFKPKVVSVMVGLDDSKSGREEIEAFEENLISLVSKIRDSGAIPIIQLQNAITDKSLIPNLELYLETAREVAENTHTVLVDHYRNWNDKELNEPGYIAAHLKGSTVPNELGHLELSKDLIRELAGITSGFTYNIEGFTHIQAEQVVPKSNTPKVSGIANGTIKLDVASILENVSNVSKVYYEIPLNNKVTITKEFNGSTEEIPNLNREKEYTVYVYAKLNDRNETLKFTPVTIIPTNGAKGIPVNSSQLELDSLAQAIKDKFKSNESIKWLFAGDSITHGALWTFGYDSFPQLFEKRIRTEMGRTSDIVINTGVSGATTTEFLANKQLRLNRYNPDVVFVMFGMNDVTSGMSTMEFHDNMTEIIKDIRTKDAIPVLMTPNPAFSGGARQNNLPSYISEVRNVAKEKDVLVIDHYKMWEDKMDQKEYIGGPSGTWMGNSIHPGYIGHLKMAQNIFSSLGIYDSSSHLSMMDYVVPGSEVKISHTASISSIESTSVTVDINQTMNIADIDLNSLDIQLILENGITYNAKAKSSDSEIMFDGLAPDSNITVKVIGHGQKENKVVKYQKNTFKLPKKEVVKKLEELIEEAKSYNNANSFYTEESYEALQQTIMDAKKMVESVKTDAEVTAMTQSLQQALEGLKEQMPEPEVDKKELQALIQKAKGYSNEKHNYTADTYNALQSAIEKAEESLDTVETQEEVTAMINSLQQAIDGLKEKEQESSNKKPNNKQPTNSNSSNDTDDSKAQDKGDKPVEDSENELPETSTSIYNWLMIGLLLVSIGTFMTIRKKIE
ncbi:GDSL-type esterase/lipase family protein [Paraliobacillus sp. PM-2]|uniref:GDSL-type esterase/lipase family protein n=1 Tax=Paraliobacillus sp. PM-2 TaxID=1462524 RepID=UPI0021003032|nr:GDSL-type esterase/lipase family protein [Paraliobacillus sp. PM-2]